MLSYHNIYLQNQIIIVPINFIRLLFSGLILLCTVFTITVQTNAQTLNINSIRFGTHPDKTRTVIDLNQNVPFRAFMLPATTNKPYRIVIDFPTFHWNNVSVTKPKGNKVLDVRSGALQPGISRIVIDLNNPTQIIDAFILPANDNANDRLVIDFKKTNLTNFNATYRKVFGTLNENNASKVITPRPKQASNEQVIIPKHKPTVPLNTTALKTPLYKPLIIIDAGHGGNDPGAIGANRVYEKHVTLAAARELKRNLENTGRYRVNLTRDRDKYIKLHRRVAHARNKKGDLFISLHADSIDNKNVRGASIYTLSNKASDAQTARLAKRENRADLIAGVDLSHEDKDVANILIDLAMRDTMNQSKFFANTIVKKMRKHGIRVLERPHRYAGFAVLKAPDIPSVLVEMGFMSNRDEVRLLTTDNYRRKMAKSLTDSIDSYFSQIQKNQTQQ